MALGWGNFLGIVADWIDKSIKFFKRKGKRDAIQGMENDVANNNNADINKRMSNLEQRARNKENGS